jgi:septal ring factor EnvC (AmiA/AmiB activator)
VFLLLFAQAAPAAAPAATNEWGAIAVAVVAVASMITSIAVAVIRRGSAAKLASVQRTVAAQGATLTEHGQKLAAHSDRFDEIDGAMEEMAKDIASVAERAADTDPNLKPTLARIESLEREVREEQAARALRYREQVSDTIKLTETLTRFDEALKFIKSQLENGNGRRRRVDG